LAAVQGGITRFDGSLGGLGGCPYAPGASGNICSGDAIHMLDAMGYDTGIDLSKLLNVARHLPGIVGHDVPSQVAKAGRITDLHPAPDYVHELNASVVSHIKSRRLHALAVTSPKRLTSLPDVRKKAEDSGTSVEAFTPAQLGEFTRKELDYWGNVIKSAKIAAD
jgi:hypothetical protein